MDGLLPVHEQCPVPRASRHLILTCICMLHAIAADAAAGTRPCIPRTRLCAFACSELKCPAHMHLAQPRRHIVVTRACAIIELLHLECLCLPLDLAVRARVPSALHLRALMPPMLQLLLEQVERVVLTLAPQLEWSGWRWRQRWRQRRRCTLHLAHRQRGQVDLDGRAFERVASAVCLAGEREQLELVIWVELRKPAYALGEVMSSPFGQRGGCAKDELGAYRGGRRSCGRTQKGCARRAAHRRRGMPALPVHRACGRMLPAPQDGARQRR